MILPQYKVEYPDKIAVKSEDGVFYLSGTMRFLVPTERVVGSWSFPFIASTTEAALAGYRKAGKLGFRDGSLLRNGGNLYVVSGGKRRRLSNPDWLTLLQLREKDFILVSDYEISLQKEGEPLA